jgi:hypothetical protein
MSKTVSLLFASVTGNCPKFYEVVSYPVDEMIGDDAFSIAEDLASMTHGTCWRMQARRAIQAYDRIRIKDETYEVCETEDENQEIWPGLSIRRLDNG